MVQLALDIRRVAVLPAALLLALLLPASAPVLHGQAPAGAPGIDGTVLDPDSKAVVNAAVVVRNEASSATVAATTDVRGRFSAAGLAQGSYAVEVFVPGFEPVRRARAQARDNPPTT